jgi:hypothetical protein
VDGLFFGLTREKFKSLAYEFVEHKAVPQPFQNVAGGCLVDEIYKETSKYGCILVDFSYQD